VLLLLVTHAAEPALASPRPARGMTLAHMVDDCTPEVCHLLQPFIAYLPLLRVGKSPHAFEFL